MVVNLAVFSSGAGEQLVELPGDTATLRQVLEAGNALPGADEKCNLVVNGEEVTDLDSIVTDGAIVTKTPRIKGG